MSSRHPVTRTGRMERRLPMGLLALVVSACQVPGSHAPAPVSDLTGRVTFVERQAQATLNDVAAAATVSLINTDRNRTEATTLTDSNGAFKLVFPVAFRPTATDSFYLEAVKGLNSNLPGASAARVRTIAVFDGGWTTLTNTTPNAGIVLNTATTALAIGAALKGTASVTPATLIGALSGTVYTPVTNLSETDFTSIRTLVNQILTDNQDPVAGINYTAPGSWYRTTSGAVSLSVASVSVDAGAIGTGLTVIGTGFDATPGNNTLRFNGVAAAVTSATPTTLTTSVPLGATTGRLSVQVGSVTAQGPTFTVTGLINGAIATQSTGVVGGVITPQ